MASRIRASPDHVFEVFCEVALPSSINEEAFILQKYPDHYDNAEVLKSVPQFSYPCDFETSTVLHFSFVLTSIDSKWTFGFCRHSPTPAKTCLVLLSALPYHDLGYSLLNEIAKLTNEPPAALRKFLDALYMTPTPEPGMRLDVEYLGPDGRPHSFSRVCPDHHRLPTIPEDRNLSEYYNAVDSSIMITIFASMLNERRIIIKSKHLNRITSCVQAANSLIFPMYWQHIFIPVLPNHLLDYLNAPMPFLIGVPDSTMKRVKLHELGDVVVVDADRSRIDTPFDDTNTLPTEIISFLRRSLKPTNNNTTANLCGDALARTFLKALVMLIGGYRDALVFPAGQKISFNQELFINTRPPNMQPFLEKMLQLQIFQQFIEGRLQMLSDGEGFNDEFEFEANEYQGKNAHNLRTQYKEWLSGIKKESSVILGKMGKTVNKTVNPVMKSAFRQVKDKGKQARDKTKGVYKGLRKRFEDKPPNSMYQSRPSNSAPSSPNTSPVRVHGLRLPGSGSGSHIKKSVSGIIVPDPDRATYHAGQSSGNGSYALELNSALANLTNGNSHLKPVGNRGNAAAQLPSSASNGASYNSHSQGPDLFGADPWGPDEKPEPITGDFLGEFSEFLSLRRISNTSGEQTSSTHADMPSSSSSEINLSLPPPVPRPRGSSGKHDSASSIKLNPPPPVMPRHSHPPPAQAASLPESASRPDSFHLQTQPPASQLRVSSGSSTHSSSTQAKRQARCVDNLIELESPPEDLLAFFDPLASGDHSTTAPSYQFNHF